MEKLSKQLLATLDNSHVQHLRWIEDANADVVVHSSEPPQGYTVPWHHHRRTQAVEGMKTRCGCGGGIHRPPRFRLDSSRIIMYLV